MAPHVYKDVLENDRVRVLEAGGSPGLNTGMHSHAGQLAIALTGGKPKFTSPDDESMEVKLNVGETMWLDPVDHATEIMGTNDVRL